MPTAKNHVTALCDSLGDTTQSPAQPVMPNGKTTAKIKKIGARLDGKHSSRKVKTQ
jgi:hypothetical protein